MRLKKGTLTPISKKTGITLQVLSNYACASKRPTRKRALFLEEACLSLGIDCPAAVWLLGSEKEIKGRLSINNS
jgi:hypothetical protein